MNSKVEQNENLSTTGQGKRLAFHNLLTLRYLGSSYIYKGGGVYTSVYLISDNFPTC